MAPSSSRRRVHIGGLPIDALDLQGAVSAIEELVSGGKGGAVFTPNVDHVVEFDQNPRLRDAYRAADLSLADGMPVVWASRLLGPALPERVAGSDLVLPLMQRARARGWRVFLLGGQEGVAALAAKKLSGSLPGLEIAGTLAPRIDMSEPRERRAEVVDAVRAARPHLVVVGFGAPKQELWIHEAREALEPAVLLGLGASIDFIAGTVPRAPAWMSRVGLEWIYRLAREPRRLWRRYVLKDPKFALILARTLLAQGSARAEEEEG
jgi:N-acetylglucosaminyldiphosphoundecaprenol N-acetyl-beta-D-mannosaminyltransferase